MVGVEAARDTLVGKAANGRAAQPRRGVERLLERAAAGAVGHRGAVRREGRRLEAVHTGSERHGARAQTHEQTGSLAARTFALPEPEVDVVLVRALVRAEPGVAVDPQDRAVDPRLRSDARRHPDGQLLAECDDEVLRRLHQRRLIGVAMRVEVLPRVALREALEELEALAGKAGERGCGRAAHVRASCRHSLRTRHRPSMPRVLAATSRVFSVDFSNLPASFTSTPTWPSAPRVSSSTAYVRASTTALSSIRRESAATAPGIRCGCKGSSSRATRVRAAARLPASLRSRWDSTTHRRPPRVGTSSAPAMGATCGGRSARAASSPVLNIARSTQRPSGPMVSANCPPPLPETEAFASVPSTVAPASPAMPTVKKYVVRPDFRSVCTPPPKAAWRPAETFATPPADAPALVLTFRSWPSMSAGGSGASSRIAAASCAAAASDRTIHVLPWAYDTVTPAVMSAPAENERLPRLSFARAPVLVSMPPTGAVSRVTANVPSERSVKVTVLSWPNLSTAMVTAHELDLERDATSHGARSRSQSPPRTMHRARMTSRGTAVAMSAPAPVAAAAVAPPPSTNATSRTTARYSTVPWPRSLRMAEPCGRSQSRRNHPIASKAQRISDGDTSARPRARGTRRDRARRR